MEAGIGEKLDEKSLNEAFAAVEAHDIRPRVIVDTRTGRVFDLSMMDDLPQAERVQFVRDFKVMTSG